MIDALIICFSCYYPSEKLLYPECHGTIYNIACAIFLCFRVVLIHEFISLLVVTFYFQVRSTFKAKLNSDLFVAACAAYISS